MAQFQQPARTLPAGPKALLRVPIDRTRRPGPVPM